MKSLSVILVAIATATGNPLNGRIFSGDNATPGQFPFIVALNDPDQFCGGAIIDKKWILTTAHCLQQVSETTTVFVGSNIEHLGGTSYNIVTIFIHEDYNDHTLKNDIGLIKIDGELEFNDFIQPSEFVEAETNSICTAVGWGITETIDFPHVVQYVDLFIPDLTYCLNIAQTFLKAGGVYLGPEQVCTLGPKGKGACFEHTGGPLVCDGKLAGIVSYHVASDYTCILGLPEVYTKPLAYDDWIKAKIQKVNL